MQSVPCIALTTGEPAGIGPDLCVQLAQQAQSTALVAIGDASLLRARASKLGLPLRLQTMDESNLSPCRKGELYLLDKPLKQPVQAGRLNHHNSSYVINILDTAVQGVTDGVFDAIVTAPVHKGIINRAGYSFSGHTEFLAKKSQTPAAVMMLVSDEMRVALASSHIPLREVADAITKERLFTSLRILQQGLQQRFNLANPRILVAGLNPHAGEGGYLGHEEQTIIQPVIDQLCREGMNIEGPKPADTLFTDDIMRRGDAILAMYHDQGLPAIKSQSFGKVVNVTLGLPFIRTSVDHGTALELAATGKANVSSLRAAVKMASNLCNLRGQSI